MPEILLGLDVGSQYIKTALVKRDKKHQIIDAEIIKTPDGSVVDGAIMYMDAISGDINAYIAKSGVKPDGLAVSINSPDIITRNLSLPVISEAEIPSAVKYEILRLFPSIKETHEITQRVISTDGSTASVLAALCPIELIKSYQELSESLNLPLRYADVHADAQAKATDYYYGSGAGGSGSGSDEEAGLLIDIGYRNSLVSVISKGKLVLSRYIMSGAAAYDNMVADKAGIDKEEVERARLSGDFSGIASISDAKISPYESESIMDMCFMEIVDQIQQTAEHYMNDMTDEKLSYITVAGEGGMIPGIEEYFARSYNLSPRELKPASNNRAAGEALMKKGNPKLLLAAVGAALASAGAVSGGGGGIKAGVRRGIGTRGGAGAASIEMNFAPAASGAAGLKQGALSARLAAVVAMALLIAVASIATGVYFIAEQRQIAIDIARIDAEIAGDTSVAEHNEAISGARSKLAALTAVVDTIDAQNLRTAKLLEELTAVAPESLFVVNFNMVDANNAVMSGRARDYRSISDFALLLRETEKYDSVRINSITANQSVSDAYTDYGFSMTIIAKAGF